MRRHADGIRSDDEDDHDIDDYNSDNDDEHIRGTADNLKVFCTSSLQYLKMKGLTSSGDGAVTVSDTSPFWYW